jgi:hypothetical protein
MGLLPALAAVEFLTCLGRPWLDVYWFITRHEESLMPIFDRIDRIIKILNRNLFNPANPVGDFSFTQTSLVG